MKKRITLSACSLVFAMLSARSASAEDVVRVALADTGKPESMLFPNDGTIGLLSSGAAQYRIDLSSKSVTPVPDASKIGFVARTSLGNEIVGEGNGRTLHSWDSVTDKVKAISMSPLGLQTIDAFCGWQKGNDVVYGCAIGRASGDSEYDERHVVFEYKSGAITKIHEKMLTTNGAAGVTSGFLGAEGKGAVWAISWISGSEIWSVGGGAKASVREFGDPSARLDPVGRVGSSLYFTQFDKGSKTGDLYAFASGAAKKQFIVGGFGSPSATFLDYATPLFLATNDKGESTLYRIPTQGPVEKFPIGSNPAAVVGTEAPVAGESSVYVLTSEPSDAADAWSIKRLPVTAPKELETVAQLDMPMSGPSAGLGSLGDVAYFAVPIKGGQRVLRTDGTTAGTGALLEGDFVPSVSLSTSKALVVAGYSEIAIVTENGSFEPLEQNASANSSRPAQTAAAGGCSVGGREPASKHTFAAFALLGLLGLVRRRTR